MSKRSSRVPRCIVIGGVLQPPANGGKDSKRFATLVGRALRRAAKTARKTARAHGTPVYIWQDGKVVAEKP